MIKQKYNRQNLLTLFLFAAYLLLLIWMILFKFGLFPQNTVERVVNLIPLSGSKSDRGGLRVSEIRANIIAFIPLGIYISILKAKWGFIKRLLIIIASAVILEAAQVAFIIGRGDITDVINNTLGGAIGVGLYILILKLLKEKTQKIINVFAGIFTPLTLLVVLAMHIARV